MFVSGNLVVIIVSKIGKFIWLEDTNQQIACEGELILHALNKNQVFESIEEKVVADLQVGRFFDRETYAQTIPKHRILNFSDNSIVIIPNIMGFQTRFCAIILTTVHKLDSLYFRIPAFPHVLNTVEKAVDEHSASPIVIADVSWYLDIPVQHSNSGSGIKDTVLVIDGCICRSEVLV